ncbi:MAG: ParB/RepB/Spo0J family partition protein [Armatimonadota bacterium]
MEKKGLGKGLSALIPGADNQEKNSINEIDIDLIDYNPYQPRAIIDDFKLQELISSIQIHGVLQPVVVRTKAGGRYELVAGERRIRASKAAGLEKIPAVIRDLSNEQSLQVALIENLQREDISAIDAALAYKRLTEDFGLSSEEIAIKIGKARSTISNTMRLLTLPKEIQQSIVEGKITEGHARAILSLSDPNNYESLHQAILAASLSVRESEKLAKEWNNPKTLILNNYDDETKEKGVSRETPKHNTQYKDPNLQAVEASLRELYKTKINIIKNSQTGKIEIYFYSEDEFERITQLLAGY